MDEWVIWLLLGIAFAVGEMATTGFFLAPFAGGAFVAALLAAIGVGGGAAIVAFILVTLILFLFVRPIARRHLSVPPELRTGTAALIGQDALVLERIANDEGVGTVRIGGEVWTARSYDEDRIIEAGERVQVMEIRGATALVTE
jgi:membrane protein implicated in regulation of membrane protease activity